MHGIDPIIPKYPGFSTRNVMIIHGIKIRTIALKVFKDLLMSISARCENILHKSDANRRNTLDFLDQ